MRMSILFWTVIQAFCQPGVICWAVGPHHLPEFWAMVLQWRPLTDDLSGEFRLTKPAFCVDSPF